MPASLQNGFDWLSGMPFTRASQEQSTNMIRVQPEKIWFLGWALESFDGRTMGLVPGIAVLDKKLEGNRLLRL